MSQFQIEEIIRKIANGGAINTRQRAFLANAPNGKIDETVAADIGLSGGDLRQAAELSIKIADGRKALLGRLVAVAAGRANIDLDDRATFLSHIRKARGSVPAEINIALDLAPTASFEYVAEALERRFSAKPKRAA